MSKLGKKRKLVLAGCGVLLIIVMVVIGLFHGKDIQKLLMKNESEDVGANEEQNGKNDSKDDGPVSIWIMGDSIAAGGDFRHSNSRGWGSMVQQYLKEDVVVRNAATSGASSKNYKEGGNYQVNIDSLQKGDYVIIQFGHNDAMMEDRSTNPYQSSSEKGSFKNILLEDYIKPIIKKGAYPILATSVVACTFDVDGELVEMPYSAHAEAMRELVQECEEKDIEVGLIDTYKITQELYQRIGETEAFKLHNDWTHYNHYGAAYTAGVVVWEMKDAGIECCQDIYTFDEVIALSEELKSEIEKVGAIEGL